LAAHANPELVEILPDGTWLAYIHPSGPKRRTKERLLVRVIDYTLDDPTRPGHAQPDRLITTLLDPACYPALDLMVLYHERWEVELTLDQVKVHQRLLPRPLRSLNPLGVIQELYALLLAHFIVPFIRHEAGLSFHLDPDQLSFVESLRLIRAAIPHHRTHPRVVKRKMSNFKLKRPEHRALPSPLNPFLKSFLSCLCLFPLLS
jgi:hypothetical protein